VIVADSSFIAEGILADLGIFRSERMLTPSLAVYEVSSAIWKHEVVLGRIHEGEKFLAVLSDLIRTRDLLAIEPDEGLLFDAHRIAIRHRAHPYDSIFVAVALRNGLELVTLDTSQRRVFDDAKSAGTLRDHGGVARP
jgi:predicted nucleic acid-binding protein